MKTLRTILLSAAVVLSAIQLMPALPVFAAETSAQAPIMAQAQQTGSAIDKLSGGATFKVPDSVPVPPGEGSPTAEPEPALPSLQPDFSNAAVWKDSPSPYNTPGLWVQCTWFAWSRFMELYGYDPGFRGNGYECVDQLLAAHPDAFTRSDTPVAGSMFSSYNHVGFILKVDGDVWTIQDGNQDLVSNPDWEEAIRDWRTVTMTRDEFVSQVGTVWFANPVNPVTFSE